MLQKHLRPLHRLATWAIIACLLGLCSLTLVTCTMVGDSLTGVHVMKIDAANCLGTCYIGYEDALLRERMIHLANLAECRGLPDPKPCIDAENNRWDQVQADLKARVEACLEDCHKQGTGSGG